MKKFKIFNKTSDSDEDTSQKSDQDENCLPILKYRDEIVKKVRNNSVVVISGATGCGKTTKVPQFILDDALERKEKCFILVSQPRKIAAMAIAKRVAMERNCTLGSLVGYQVGLDKKIDKFNSKTSLLFCTTGIILRRIIHEQGIEHYTHIILDEIHERDIETDLLITVIRNYLIEMTCSAKIILMSATINIDRFVKYFTLSLEAEYMTLEERKQRVCNASKPVKTIVCHPKVVLIETLPKEKNYNVEIKYLNELSSMKPLLTKSTDLQVPTITSEIFNLAAKIVTLYLNENSNSVLLFLPGIYEIETAYAVLSNNSKLEGKCIFYVLHSSLPAKDQKEIFRPASLPKVILSTNIAESSVTLPNIGCIIDFCLTKNIVGSETSLSSLKLEWTTKHSCIQRAGRTGRMCDGIVYRLVDKSHYDNFIEEILPEMTRAPLETVILRVKLLSSEMPHLFLKQTMNPPKNFKVFRTVLILKELGALTMLGKNNTFTPIDGDLTFVGRVMATLPIDVRLAKLVALGWIFSVLSETIIIAAGLSGKNLFKNHFDEKMNDYTQKLYWANGSCCDSIAILNAYRFWQHAVERGDLRNWNDEQTFCDKYNFERKALHEMRQLIYEMESRLGDLLVDNDCVKVWNQRETHFIIKLCVAGAFIPNYFMQNGTDEVDERNVSKILCGLDPYQTVYFSKMDSKCIGELYIEQIKEKLVSEGITDSASSVDVKFDSSKILVQFAEPNTIIDTEDYNCDAKKIRKQTIFPGKIPKEIYLSVFFRKLINSRKKLQKNNFERRHSSIKLNVLPTKHQEEEYAIKNGLGEMIDGTFKIKNHFINPPHKCVLPSFATKSFLGIVTHVEHCNKFYVQPLDGTEVYLEELETKLPFEDFFRLENPQKDMLVIVFHETSYKRARIVDVIDHDQVVDCFIIDYGYIVEIPFSEIFILSNQKMEVYFSLSELCLDCTLTEISPSIVKCPRGKWTAESINVFRQIVLNQQCEIEVYSVVDDKVSVILHINDINVNHYMEELCYARKSNESFLSKINHSERVNVQTSSGEWITRDIEFKSKVNKLMKKTIQAPPLIECNRIIRLEGPFSPLESGIREIKLQHNGTVAVNHQSVNYITLNDNLENGNEGKLLIAAEVFMNSTEDSLSLCNVTVMPNLNGLPAILAMMFAPAIAFYRDEQENIVKIRFGMGADADQKEATFYEHDCMLPINFNIDNEDIQDINEFRSCISQLYNEAFSIKDFEKKECKAEIKNLISKIFGKERPLVKQNEMTNTVIDNKWPLNDNSYLIVERSALEKPYIPANPF